MRLDRFIASNSGLSRRDAKKHIKSGSVLVNNIRATGPDQMIDEYDQVRLNGAEINPLGTLYFMLNKPKGLVCATEDSRHSTVLELFPANIQQQLHIVGRLDKDTTGLLFLSNDGQWSHRIASPKHQCSKTYRVHCREKLKKENIERFNQGLILGGTKQEQARPARLEILDSKLARVTVTEGKYHLVKRLFKAIANEVLELHREQIGSLSLDSKLSLGDFRPLTNSEIELF